ncbi:glycosyltransferase BC10-like [Heracleum sosnowskyi]|uniref:Glycosyltransferase BC10-like n=1 Tax=Heracleum sosnowskyi TaxID=360622 RepID=A0AAD8HTM5_9APIA|nr:glycosyltransferase BC10-like [Heracleum sosnowskyi]
MKIPPAFSPPPPISPSHFIANDTNGTQNKDSKESSERPAETMYNEPDGTQNKDSKESSELPAETMYNEPDGMQNNDLKKSTDLPAGTMDIEPNECKTLTRKKAINTGLAFDQNPSPIQVMHNMSDDELASRALSVDHENDQNEIVPKIAFMFLARGDLPLAPLWDLFFKGQEGHYSIYVHTQPTFNGTFPENSVFHGRRIPSKPVEWANFTMIKAEKRLLANALLDTSNQRFVLLSESCIPLFNFPTVYSYLINSTQNFVEAYDLRGSGGRGRYNLRMMPEITLEQWRKGSQWFQIDRELALQIISDRKYIALFKKFSKPARYSDEHYIPTFVSMKFWERNSNRTLTWVDWAFGRAAHPTSFGRLQVTIKLLKGMRSGRKCTYNGKKTNVCCLFARKFLPSALDRLLKIAPKIMKF